MTSIILQIGDMLRMLVAEVLHGSSLLQNRVQAEISKDPLFADPAHNDFRLKDGSPCIGAGENGTDMGAIPKSTGMKKVSWGSIKRLYNQ